MIENSWNSYSLSNLNNDISAPSKMKLAWDFQPADAHFHSTVYHIFQKGWRGPRRTLTFQRTNRRAVRGSLVGVRPCPRSLEKSGRVMISFTMPDKINFPNWHFSRLVILKMLLMIHHFMILRKHFSELINLPKIFTPNDSKLVINFYFRELDWFLAIIILET